MSDDQTEIKELVDEIDDIMARHHYKWFAIIVPSTSKLAELVRVVGVDGLEFRKRVIKHEEKPTESRD